MKEFLSRARLPKISFNTPAFLVLVLAALGLGTAIFAGWGLLRMANLAAEFRHRDERLLSASVALKEHVASYSRLAYDYLLQQDFDRMMLKEKESNGVRAAIEQNLAQLDALDEPAARDLIKTIHGDVIRFLAQTDKALETAAEDGSAQKARAVLQEQAEQPFTAAENGLTRLIQSRRQMDTERLRNLRQQAFMMLALLAGLAALTLAALMSVWARMKAFLPAGLPAVLPAAASFDPADDPGKVEARSLAALAFASRLARLRKETDDLRSLLQRFHSFTGGEGETPAADTLPNDVNVLSCQNEKISHAVGRIQHVHEQSKLFMDKLSDMMAGLQKLATDGNVVALNVTIELARLQAQGGGVMEDKNRVVSEQIRALATSAAGITGKLAMVLSQYRYAQEDFTRYTGELAGLKQDGNESFDRIRAALQSGGQSARRLSSQRDEIADYLPMLDDRLAELESQISQLQATHAAEIGAVSAAEPPAFKLITGGVA